MDFESSYFFECKAFGLKPEFSTYWEMESFCLKNRIDRSSWKSVYLGLLTLLTFGPDLLPYVHSEVDQSSSVVVMTGIKTLLVEAKQGLVAKQDLAEEKRKERDSKRDFN